MKNRTCVSKIFNPAFFSTGLILGLFMFLSSGCVVSDGSNGNAANRNEAVKNANTSPASTASEADPYGDDVTLSKEQLEQGRMDQDWKKYVNIAKADQKKAAPDPEKWQDISAERVNAGPMHLPLSGDVAGPSVFGVQVLLDRSRFSPGVIDGQWGKNTEKAIYWLQSREGLPATGQVDEKTFQRLKELAGNIDALVTERKLSADDVAGPFVQIPQDIYEKAKLKCMCYESVEEKLAETYHVTPELLEQLNPKVNLKEVKAGDTIMVPNLNTSDKGDSSNVAELIVSDGGHYLHAVDGNGRIIYHFPSTLGSEYNPSPSGSYKVTSITQGPDWHYQPKLLGEDPSKETAIIPAGPNNAVGAVWMALSKPHFGIHGTSAPETIGYATSHGCIRLTNWDALFLSHKIKPGIDVHFRDLARPAGSEDASR